MDNSEFDEYRASLEKDFDVMTTDGLTMLPSRQTTFSYDRNYSMQACIMFFDT